MLLCSNAPRARRVCSKTGSRCAYKLGALTASSARLQIEFWRANRGVSGSSQKNFLPNGPFRDQLAPFRHRDTVLVSLSIEHIRQGPVVSLIYGHRPHGAIMRSPQPGIRQGHFPAMFTAPLRWANRLFLHAPVVPHAPPPPTRRSSHCRTLHAARHRRTT
jgi:hypothetical protein